MGKPERIYLAGPMTGYPGHNFATFHQAAERLKAAGWEVVNPAENFGGRTDLPRSSYMRADVAALIECDAIALLPGWQDSRGAKVEYLLAREMGLPIYDTETMNPLRDLPDASVVLMNLKTPSAVGRCRSCGNYINLDDVDTSGGHTRRAYDANGKPCPELCGPVDRISNQQPNEPILDEAKRLTSCDRQADYGHPRDDFARTAAMWNGILAAKLREGTAITAMDVPLCLIAVKLARQAHRHKRDNLVDIAGYARTAAMVAGEE